MRINWKRIFWQVVFPTLGPIVLSGLIVLLWATGPANFKVSWPVVLDVSPWALTFYTFALLGSTVYDAWSKLSNHKVVGASLITLVVAVVLYAAFMVIWRHDSTFAPGTGVYFVTLLLLFISVGLCHHCLNLT